MIHMMWYGIPMVPIMENKNLWDLMPSIRVAGVSKECTPSIFRGREVSQAWNIIQNPIKVETSVKAHQDTRRNITKYNTYTTDVVSPDNGFVSCMSN